MRELNALLAYAPVESWELEEIANEVPALPTSNHQGE